MKKTSGIKKEDIDAVVESFVPLIADAMVNQIGVAIDPNEKQADLGGKLILVREVVDEVFDSRLGITGDGLH